jgi:hypothetical protein
MVCSALGRLSVRRHSPWLLAAAIASATATGIAVAALPRPEYVAVCVLALLVCLGLLIRPILGPLLVLIGTLVVSGTPRGWPLPVFRLNELLLGAVVAVFVARSLLRGITRRRMTLVSSNDAAFAVWYVSGAIIPAVAMLVRGERLALDSMLVLFAPLQYYALYRVFIEVVATEKDISLCLKAWLGSGLFVTLVGIGQALRIAGIPAALASIAPGKHTRLIADGLLRVTSLFGNWHAMAAFLVIQGVIAVVLMLYGRDAPVVKTRWASPIVLALTLIAFVPVVSLAGVVGAIVSGITLIYLGRQSSLQLAYKILVPVVLLLVSAVVVFHPFVLGRLGYQFRGTGILLPTTFRERLRIWEYVVAPEVRDNLLVGSGLLIPEHLGIATEESYYAFLLLRGGLVALLGYCASTSLLVARAYRVFCRGSGVARVASHITVVVLVATLVMNASNAYWGYSGIAETIWMLIALTEVAARRSRQDQLSRQGGPRTT